MASFLEILHHLYTKIDATLRSYQAFLEHLMHPIALVLAFLSGIGVLSAVLPLYNNNPYGNKSILIRCGTADPPPYLDMIPQSFP